MPDLISRSEEKKMYCEDFCPIYNAIRDYNASHGFPIFCATKMCENITDAYMLNHKECADMRKKVNDD